MQASNVKSAPLIMSLPKIDFWYWCNHFVDLSRGCPYRCGYCNTQNSSSLQGIEFKPGLQRETGLPREKEVIGLGLLSDAFQPGDEENEWISAALRSLYDAGYPVNIVTKSARIVDIVELLKRFARRDFIRVTFTILTLDDTLACELEGDSPPPRERLQALSTLRKEGIPAGVALTPLIPRVNDPAEQVQELIREAKQSGASWLLFSGFDPVQSFLKDPRWKKTAELHGDAERLRSHYRELKNSIVGLLMRENLPMRIPRITLNLFHQRSSTRLVSEYLFNISYLYELMERNVEMLRYRRAADEINRNPVSLRSLMANKKLGYVRGINPEIERVIEEVLSTEKSSLYMALRERIAAEI